MGDRVRAAIYAPATAPRHWRDVCSRYAMSQGYDVVMVTGSVDAVQQVLDRREVDIIVCGREAHRRELLVLPRIEVVSTI